MKKFSERQLSNFWQNIHLRIENDLAAVCFPDKPLYFNRFFNRVQKYAINKYIKNEKLSLEGKKVLDIGCGRGRWLSFFKEKYGAIVAGVDLSDYAVQACKDKGFNAYKASITQMPFEDNCFDFISSITVLMHLPYELKEKAISEISRVLKAGGKIIILESTRKDPSPHVYGLSVLEWGKLFNKHGMSLVHKSGHCFNLSRMRMPSFTPLREFIAILLDYPLEYALMNYFYGKQSQIGLQHLMVFEK